MRSKTVNEIQEHKETLNMSDVAVQHGVATGVYEPSLFGTYSKKIGMWLFLLSDSLTFGALLFAYSYGRISTPNWPTPFHSESIRNATLMTAFLLTSSLTMVLAVRAAVFGNAKAQRWWLLATMACGTAFVILHGREWSKLIAEGLTLPMFPAVPGHEAAAEYKNVAETVPQDRKSTRLNSSHQIISYAVFCLKKKKRTQTAA